MLIFDLFSGTGSSTQAFADAGHTVIRIELDEYFQAEERDVLAMTADYLINKYGQPDFVWASPPCTAFSVASMGHHWGGGAKAYQPKTEVAVMSQKLVAHTLKLIKELNPQKGWLMENPRGMLRKLPVVENYPRQTITYCTYGDSRMKPTDLWGGCKVGFLGFLAKMDKDATKQLQEGHELGLKDSRAQKSVHEFRML
jgi:hypothetical protein